MRILGMSGSIRKSLSLRFYMITFSNILIEILKILSPKYIQKTKFHIKTKLMVNVTWGVLLPPTCLHDRLAWVEWTLILTCTFDHAEDWKTVSSIVVDLRPGNNFTLRTGQLTLSLTNFSKTLHALNCQVCRHLRRNLLNRPSGFLCLNLSPFSLFDLLPPWLISQAHGSFDITFHNDRWQDGRYTKSSTKVIFV